MKERFIVIEQSICVFSGEINANPVSFEGKEIFETELEADQATRTRIVEVVDGFRQAYDWDWEQIILEIVKGDMILTGNYVGGDSLTAEHLFKTHKVKGD